MGDFTKILAAAELGDPRAADELLPLVYDELRNLAAARLAHERPGQTLGATALVHEAYVRLVAAAGNGSQPHWDGRRHFFAAAAEAMRRILIENARRKQRIKRGGNLQRVDLLEQDLAIDEPPDALLALDEALSKLATEDAQAAELVKLQVFAGMSVEDAGRALGHSRATAYRHWNYARAWLRCELNSLKKPTS